MKTSEPSVIQEGNESQVEFNTPMQIALFFPRRVRAPFAQAVVAALLRYGWSLVVDEVGRACWTAQLHNVR